MTGLWRMPKNLFISFFLLEIAPLILLEYDKILVAWGRGVAANMRPCQGRDRGFEPRRSRQVKILRNGDFLIRDRTPPQEGIIRTPSLPPGIKSSEMGIF